MDEIEIKLTKEIEQKAMALGASRMNVYKWRQRGIPPKWQLKLLTANRLKAPSRKGEAAE